ncbi:exodeoxyribonuclease VII large subunit [Patescibacteria group bacterium]
MSSQKIYQVSEFNKYINDHLEKVGVVVVEGELSEINVSQGKFVFATIQDKEANVGVFGLSFNLPGFDLLTPGMLVHVYGKPRLYQKSGKFSIFAEKIVPAGEGALRIAFENLKKKLAKNGFFAPERKRPIPKFPEKIGLITAKGSRAYGDFVKVLKNRMGGIKVFYFSVNVQGQNSVESIVKAFACLNKQNPEAIVLIRGGGSLEDLMSFNDERVAQAIFASKAPVVCGVGHEDDLTIADLVADLRASTPSNAAELLVRDRKEVLFVVLNNIKTIDDRLRGLVREKNSKIIRSIQVIENSIQGQIGLVSQLISRLFNQFSLQEKGVRDLKNNRDDLQKRLYVSVDLWFTCLKTKVKSLARLFESFSFSKILQRGFSITFGSDGKVLKASEGVGKGSEIKTILFNGKITSRVLNIKKN